MQSSQSNVIVIIRIAGNVLACVKPDGQPVRVRKIGVSTGKVPDQTNALRLLRA